MENPVKDNKQTDPMPSTKDADDAVTVNDGSKPDKHKESEESQKQHDQDKEPVLGESKTKILDETTI